MLPSAPAAEATPEPQRSADLQLEQEAASSCSQIAEASAHVQRPLPPHLSTQSDSSDDDDDDCGVKPEIVLGPDGLPSLGSSGHATGDCKRCCFFPKNRCTNGHDCNFCHFDHDKRKRLKKKKKKRGAGGSEQQTPSSSAGGATPGSVTTPFGLAGSPLGLGAVGVRNRLLGMQPGMPVTPSSIGGFAGYPGIPMTPTSPHMPPFAPPSLSGIRLEETPPPPPPPSPPPPPQSNAEAASASSTMPAVDTDVASVEQPPLQKRPPPLTILEDPQETAAAATHELPEKITEEKSSVVSLTDLLAAAVPLPEPPPIPLVPPGQMGIPHVKPESPRLAPAPWEPPLPIWPPQTPSSASVAPSPHGCPSLHWPAGFLGAYAPGLQPEWFTPLSTPSGAQPYAVDSPAVAPFSPASPSGIHPWFASIPSTPTTVPQAIMKNDSPRSVILTLSGAWGALTTAKSDGVASPKKGRIDLSKIDSQTVKASVDGRLARSELLDFRKAFSGPRPPALKSLRVSRVM